MVPADLLERMLEGGNLRRALRRVQRNQGAPGIDGMTVEELPGYLRGHWLELQALLLQGRYQPQPVRRVTIPKPGGGERHLGVPTVLDRFVQQALMQVLQGEWDAGFTAHSYGFRPGRSAHQAVRAAQGYVRAGYGVVVDLDLEKFVDRVNHDVRSWAAGERVRASVTRYLAQRLRLQVNAAKSAVDWAWNRSFLGFTVTRDSGHRLKVSATALTALRDKTRAITGRTRGRTLRAIVAELRQYFVGWRAYFGVAEVPAPLRELDKWVRRRLRSYVWKQWGRAGYRQLRARGVGRELAWNTCKSAHGPWRLSQSPALVMALPAPCFRALGLPTLAG